MMCNKNGSPTQHNEIMFLVIKLFKNNGVVKVLAYHISVRA